MNALPTGENYQTAKITAKDAKDTPGKSFRTFFKAAWRRLGRAPQTSVLK
jgi:hypothetical protein